MLGKPFDEYIDDALLCAVGKFDVYGVGLCHGDSGSPLVDGERRLVGIALWDVPDNFPCAIGHPNQFTRVSAYIDWIEDHANVSIV